MLELYQSSYFGDLDTIVPELEPYMRSGVRPSPRWGAERDSALAAQRNLHFQSLPAPPARLLEIGPGSGLFMIDALDRGYEVVGLEPSKERVEAGLDRGLRIMHGSVDDLDEMLDGFGEFEAIYLSHVLEHLYRPAVAIQRMRSLLSVGGVVVAEVPNQVDGWVPKMKRIIRTPTMNRPASSINSVHHVNFFNAKALARIFEEHGFSVTVSTVSSDEMLRLSRPATIWSAVDKVATRVASAGQVLQVRAVAR